MGGRGRQHMKELKKEVLQLVQEARDNGARLKSVCDYIGISVKSIQRWLGKIDLQDKRKGPTHSPAKLSLQEENQVLQIANMKEFRSKSPHQIVPTLADRGIYIASESTFYRVLRKHDQIHHRGKEQIRGLKSAPCLKASKPNQVYSWDITYLKSKIKGQFYYLYLMMDIWSRKIVGYRVEDCENMYYSAELFEEVFHQEKLKPNQVTLHADNGGPMKGSMMHATLQKLGVVPSFSRPRNSDDNPYSEAIFKTLKYRPNYPSKPFKDLEKARDWVSVFVNWYNNEHLHSGIGFVTPGDRHSGKSSELLEKRRELYVLAKKRHPERWSGKSRAWNEPQHVYINSHLHPDTLGMVA